jgi:phospholipid transport system substrate-binding protein
MAKFLSGAGRTALALVLFGAAVSRPIHAEPAPTPPIKTIDALDQSLLGVMKQATNLGYQGRYSLLEPVIKQAFNLPLMTQLVVGPAWTGWTQSQRDEVTDAFRRFITATYARRFDGFSGEDFVIDGERQGPNGTIVMTRLVRPHDPAVAINYLVRDKADAAPQVVDVYLTGTISELATRHSEFGAVLEHDGYAGLLAALDKKADSQAKTP